MAKKKEEYTEQSSVYDVIKLIGATEIVDEIQRKFRLAASTTDVEARRSTTVSTGLLMTDIVLNGGIYPAGWYTFFGGEGSAKSSTMMNILSSVYGSNVPLIDMRDAEGSTSADYIETMARSSGVAREFDVKKAFGVSDPKTGKWVIPPRIRYTSDNSLEGTWKSISAILKRLPDKAYIDGDWWLLFDRTKENISKFKGQGNKKIGDQYNKIAIKSLDGGSMQALFIVDSLPALVAEADDEDEGTNAMAISARGHAKHIPKVKGRLKRKHCTILVVNQIRLNPGAMMGNPEYEPGGQAPKFASDVRIKHTARSVPHGKGSTEEEDSVQFKSGVDTYRYIHLRAIKNKYGTPNVEAWHRLWLSDPIGKAHGFCPVWDCLTGDTKVYTNKGLIPIKDIPEYSNVLGTYNGVTALEGIKVLSNDGKFHEVTNWGKKGTKQIFEVSTKHGHSIKGSANHLVEVLTPTGDRVWKKIKDIKAQEDYLIVNKDAYHKQYQGKVLSMERSYHRTNGYGKNQYTDQLPRRMKINEPIAYLLGYLVTDGWCSDRQCIFYTSDPKNLEQIKSAIRSIGLTYTIRKRETGIKEYKGKQIHTQKTPFEVAVYSKELVELFKQCGLLLVKAPQKRVPEVIFRCPKHIKIEFLRGLYAGDGSISNIGGAYISYSPEMLKDVHSLLNTVGVSAQLRLSQRCVATHGSVHQDFLDLFGGQFIRHKTSHKKWKPTQELKRWDEKLPMPSGRGYNLTVANLFSQNPVISQDVRSHLAKYRQVVRSIFNKGFVLSKVEDVKSLGKEMTYDISVADTQNFVANGVVVHNCYQYLLVTGQLEGTMGRGFTITLGKWTSPKLKWLDFKALILLEGKALKEECQRLGIDKNPKIRETCFKQIRSGEGLDLYYQTISGLNEEDEVPYDEWDDSEIVDEVVERGLMDKKNAKKSKIKDLIKLLEADDLNEEDDEEGTDEDDE